MVRYFVAALALRFFSASPSLQSIYRWLGNHKKSRPITLAYTRYVWEQAAAARVLEPGRRLLELGTGWTHANSLYVALVGHASIALFDVVDNRSLAVLKSQIPAVLDDIMKNAALGTAVKEEAQHKAERALAAATLDEVYQILNMEYQLSATGIPNYPGSAFDFIYSIDVLEHVNREAFAKIATHWHSLLKPGGLFVCQVGLDDHLAHYDLALSPKTYLRHSNNLWRGLLQNNLQYINRLTMSEILQALRDANFEIEEQNVESCDISALRIHPDYAHQSREDQAAVRLTFRARAVAARA